MALQRNGMACQSKKGQKMGENVRENTLVYSIVQKNNFLRAETSQWRLLLDLTNQKNMCGREVYLIYQVFKNYSFCDLTVH